MEPFPQSPRARDLAARLDAFITARVEPAEATFFAQRDADRWRPPPVVEALKSEARAEGLWNLFLPESDLGAGLTNVEYAPMAERMGRVVFASEVFNCNAPDTGNMEVLARYGTDAQKARWLEPLLRGEIRSGFAMTEPEVASSDATNIQGRIARDGDDYVINARKWWTSGAGDPRCAVLIVMGRSNDGGDRHRQQSMILVPMNAPGVRVERMLPVFGYDDAPHGHAEITFTDVRVPADNLLLGEGAGFEIAQGRLGPGRVHHCMRLIGLAERALEAMCRRLMSRVAFGHRLAENPVWRARIAQARVRIDQARLLVMHCAHRMDTVGNKVAKADIAAIKAAVPPMACAVIDDAMQAFGAAGLCDDHGLAYAYAQARLLRIADGPDEVHLDQLGRMELAKYKGR
jgi:acyl-CoA dehydrogenase